MTWNFGIGPLDLWPLFWSQGQRSRSRSKFWPFPVIASPFSPNNIDKQFLYTNVDLINTQLCVYWLSPSLIPVKELSPIKTLEIEINAYILYMECGDDLGDFIMGVFDLRPTSGSKGHYRVLDFDLSYKIKYRKNSFCKMYILVIRSDLVYNWLIWLTFYGSYLPFRP